MSRTNATNEATASTAATAAQPAKNTSQPSVFAGMTFAARADSRDKNVKLRNLPNGRQLALERVVMVFSCDDSSQHKSTGKGHARTDVAINFADSPFSLVALKSKPQLGHFISSRNGFDFSTMVTDYGLPADLKLEDVDFLLPYALDNVPGSELDPSTSMGDHMQTFTLTDGSQRFSGAPGAVLSLGAMLNYARSLPLKPDDFSALYTGSLGTQKRAVANAWLVCEEGFLFDNRGQAINCLRISGRDVKPKSSYFHDYSAHYWASRRIIPIPLHASGKPLKGSIEPRPMSGHDFIRFSEQHYNKALAAMSRWDGGASTERNTICYHLRAMMIASQHYFTLKGEAELAEVVVSAIKVFELSLENGSVDPVARAKALASVIETMCISAYGAGDRPQGPLATAALGHSDAQLLANLGISSSSSNKRGQDTESANVSALRSSSPIG